MSESERVVRAGRLVTVPGQHTYRQAVLAGELRRRVEEVQQPDKETERGAQLIGFIFERSQIESRHLELEMAALGQRRDWYAAANQATESLAARVLEKIFPDRADAQRCDALVVVTSTYAGFPSLSRRLQERAGFRLDALCFDLAGLGCAGPTHGWLLADHLVRDGAETVCLVCADAMGTFGYCRRFESAPRLEETVAHCLASDGGAGLLLSTRSEPEMIFSYRRARVASRLWAGTLDQNDLGVSADNQPLIAVGAGIRHRLAEELDAVVDEAVLGAPLLMHPGGAALMKTVGERYPTLAPSAARSMHVLRHHGNLGGPSVLFVFEEALRDGLAVTPELRLLALGPGIVTTLLHLEGAHPL